MAVFMDLKGTSQASFQISKGGARVKNSSGVIEARNAADGAYADLVAEILKANSSEVQLNSNAAGSGADWKMSLKRPTTGMTAAVNYTLPAVPTNGYVLSTDASGNLSWVAPATAPTGTVTQDTTTLVFGDSSPVAMFTLPANAVVNKVEVIVDTAFDGTPTLNIGISGTTNKYMDAAQVDLTSGAEDRWESNPNKAPVGTTEAIIATYVAGGASAGSARIIVSYSNPN
jgi:hypothetical protein